ncbi:MAG: protoporphyrinogen/coproporphyrinogen oxidase [Fimbriimonas sp.]
MKKVLIVGGGLSGIGAAIALSKSGIDFELHEKTNQVGGKVASEYVEGFTLDRGFQVYFSSYTHEFPSGLGLEKLNWGSFKNGAMLCYDGSCEPIDKSMPLVSALSPAFGIKDKLLVLKLTLQIKSLLAKNLKSKSPLSMREFLQTYGFSDLFITRFAEPFWGGITLDRDLKESSNKLLRAWSYLSSGKSVIPAGGMGVIPATLSKVIPPDRIHLNSQVVAIKTTENGFEATFTDEKTNLYSHVLAPTNWSYWNSEQSETDQDVNYKSSTAVWFAADQLPIKEPYLILNSNPNPVVNTLAPMSLAQPSYAPKGQHLACASLLGLYEIPDSEIESLALADLQTMYPTFDFSNWRVLRIDRIKYAQVEETGLSITDTHNPNGYIRIGEQVSGSGINHAFLNGYQAGSQL